MNLEGKDEGAPTSKSMLTDHICSFLFVSDNKRTRDSTVPCPEGWEVHFADTTIRESTHTDSLSLKVFKRSRDVKKAFAAATN